MRAAKSMLLPVAAVTLFAQSTMFDVVSIKLRTDEITFSRDPGVRRAVRGTASTLNDLITYAYSVRYDQIAEAPQWAGNDHYDLDAKSDGEGVLKDEEARLMMQAVLADRFQLRFHRENREMPAYDLVVLKNGPKFKSAAPDAPGGFAVRGGPRGLHMEARKVTMEQLAHQLIQSVGRPVVDRDEAGGLLRVHARFLSRQSDPPRPTSRLLRLWMRCRSNSG